MDTLSNRKKTISQNLFRNAFFKGLNKITIPKVKQRKYQQFTQTNVLYKLNMKIDEFVRNGSGRVLHHLECIYFGVLKYNPLKLL